MNRLQFQVHSHQACLVHFDQILACLPGKVRFIWAGVNVQTNCNVDQKSNSDYFAGPSGKLEPKQPRKNDFALITTHSEPFAATFMSDVYAKDNRAILKLLKIQCYYMLL